MRVATRISEVHNALTEHAYPRPLHESARLFKLFHHAVHLTTLRSWYVRAALRKILRSRSGRLVLLDIGCGSGDHVFYALRCRPQVEGIGIDRAEDAIALCRRHASESGISTPEFFLRDVEEVEELPPADVILCITMLQYVGDDVSLLHKIRRALAGDGVFLLYVPVRNERILPFHDGMVSGGPSDYDAVQRRRRVYEPGDVARLVGEAGFKIDRVEEAYGLAGKLAYEIHSLLIHGAASGSFFQKAASIAAAPVAVPCMALCMALDYVAPVRRGNGLLIQAS